MKVEERKGKLKFSLSYNFFFPKRDLEELNHGKMKGPTTVGLCGK